MWKQRPYTFFQLRPRGILFHALVSLRDRIRATHLDLAKTCVLRDAMLQHEIIRAPHDREQQHHARDRHLENPDHAFRDANRFLFIHSPDSTSPVTMLARPTYNEI